MSTKQYHIESFVSQVCHKKGLFKFLSCLVCSCTNSLILCFTIFTSTAKALNCARNAQLAESPTQKPLIASGIAPRNAPTPTPPPSTSPPTALVNFLGVRYIMCSCSLHISVAHTVPHISQWLHVYTVKYDCSQMSFHICLVSTTSHPHSRYTRSS